MAQEESKRPQFCQGELKTHMEPREKNSRSRATTHRQGYLHLPNLSKDETEKEACGCRPTYCVESTPSNRAACGARLVAEACSVRAVAQKPAVAAGGRGRKRSIMISLDIEAPLGSAEGDSFHLPLQSAGGSRISANADEGKPSEHRTIHGASSLPFWPLPVVSASPATPSPPSPYPVSVVSFSDVCSPSNLLVDSMPVHSASSLQILERSSVAQTSVGKQTNRSRPVLTVCEHPTAAAAAEPVRAGGRLPPHVAAAVDDKAPAEFEAVAFLDSRNETSPRLHCFKPRKPPAPRRWRARLLPQGFSLAHIPEGFLWCRPRVGALRLVYKKTGNPDCLLLIGPNWNFAISMFFVHVVGMAFFVYLFHKGLKDDLWLFAGGVTLCLVTFTAFLCTVFKDPGLPLEICSADGQRQRLKPVLTRLHPRERPYGQSQQQIFRVQREYRRLVLVRKTLIRRGRSAPVVLPVDQRRIRQQILPSTERENILCRGCQNESASQDDRSCLCRGSPHTALSKTPERRERPRLPLGNSPVTSSGGDGAGSRSEDSYVRGRSRDSSSGSGSTSDSDDSADTHDSSDTRDNSDSISEMISETNIEMNIVDGQCGVPNYTSEENSDSERRICVRRNEQVTAQAWSPRKLADKSARLKRNVFSSVFHSRSLRGQRQPQLNSGSPPVVGKKTDNRQRAVLGSREEDAKMSVANLLNSPRESAVKLNVQSPYGTERQSARRGKLVKSPEEFFAPGLQRLSGNEAGFNVTPAESHPDGSPAEAILPQSSGVAHFSTLRNYVKKRLVQGLKFSRRGQTWGKHGRVKNSPRGKNTSLSRSRFCVACRIVPPPGSYHCEECCVCIEGYDHHCPWTSKCIGKGNTREFYTWILFTLVTIFYAGVATTLLRKNDGTYVDGGETRDAMPTGVSFSP